MKLETQSEYDKEKIKNAKTNIESYRKQNKSLEDKCSVYSSTIGKHEHSISVIKEVRLYLLPG